MNGRKRHYKVWSILLIVMMLFSMMPLSAFASDLVQLDKPTNLKWNVTENGETLYGCISWETVENCEGEYFITLFKDGKTYKLPSGHSSMVGWTNLYQDVAYLNLSDYFYESGTYTFSVVAEGDDINYSDSEAAVSEESFVYVKPDVELGIATDLKWVNTTRYWKPVEGATLYRIYYYKDGRKIGSSAGSVRGLSVDGEWLYTNDSWLYNLIDRNGAGEYSFQIQAISDDIMTIANGQMSEMSPVNNIGTVAQSVKDSLEGWNTAIEAGSMTAVDARSELMDEDCGNLAAALAVSNTAVNSMSDLESAYQEEQGITVQIDVTDEAMNSGVSDAANIAITGAALNTSASNGEVTFNISKSKTDYPMDNALQYKNTVFMDMNLTGDGINPDGSLVVPVHVKMPVPDNITVPDRFRVLHFLNSSGEYELIAPAIKKENGIYYASFVLTHFSPFAFTEAKTQEEMENSGGSHPDTALKGDVNLDTDVNMDDVVALLNHVVKAEVITDSVSLSVGEVTGDSDLNMDDVVKLLNYVVKAIDSLD